MPIGPRARRTRTALLSSAERLYNERGFMATSLAEVAADAGVSLATLYQYFADRNDIVAALAGESALRMLAAGVDEWSAGSGRIGLRRAIGALVRCYWHNRSFFTIWEPASQADQRLATLRRDMQEHFRRRFARALAAGAGDGLLRDDLDPDATARAMTVMVSAYCYDVFVFDPPDPAASIDDVTDLLTTIWADAVGLQERVTKPSGTRR